MNKIRVLLNAVKGSNIKVNITMNNGITYNCYIVDYLDTNRFRVSRKYNYIDCEDKKYNTIDVNYICRVVIRASH